MWDSVIDVVQGGIDFWGFLREFLELREKSRCFYFFLGILGEWDFGEGSAFF